MATTTETCKSTWLSRRMRHQRNYAGRCNVEEEKMCLKTWQSHRDHQKALANGSYVADAGAMPDESQGGVRSMLMLFDCLIVGTGRAAVPGQLSKG